MADECLREARAVAISKDERMMALLLQEQYTPTLPPNATPSGVASRSRVESSKLVWAVEDMQGSLFVLDPSRHFTIGRSSKCQICVDPKMRFD